MIKEDCTKNWQDFLTYLLIDRKLKSTPKNLCAIKSKFGKLLDFFGNKPFNRHEFTSFIASLREQKYKNSYINGFIKIAKHYDKFTGTNEIQDYSFFKETYEDIEVLTRDEVKEIAIVQYPYTRNTDELNHRDYVVISFLYASACRIGELEELLWEDIKDSPIPHVVFRDTKSNEIQRVIISKKIYKLLLSLPKHGKRVFDSRTGKIFSRNEFGKRLHERAKLCNINKKVTHHIFRHSRGTHLIMIYKLPLEEVSLFLRHKDPATTRRYNHPLMSELAHIAYASPFESEQDSFMESMSIGKEYISHLVDPKKHEVYLRKDNAGDMNIVIHTLS